MACFLQVRRISRPPSDRVPIAPARCLLPFLVPSSRPVPSANTVDFIPRHADGLAPSSRSHPVPDHRPKRKRPPRRSGACRLSHSDRCRELIAHATGLPPRPDFPAPCLRGPLPDREPRPASPAESYSPLQALSPPLRTGLP